MRKILVNKPQVLFLALISSLLWLAGCDSANKVPRIEINLDFQRTDLDMYACAQALHDTPQLSYQAAYDTYLSKDKSFYYELLSLPYNIPGIQPGHSLVDTLIARNMCSLLADSNTYVLLDTVRRAFPDTYDFLPLITPMLKRFQYQFAEDSIQLPAFRTHINGYIPESQLAQVDLIFISPSYISFGLHYLLGENYRFYPYTLPSYIRKRFQTRYLPVHLAQEMAEGVVAPIDPAGQPSLLDKIIREGIKLYFCEQLLPEMSDSMHLFYTGSQLEWATYYEADIYKMLSPHFYSTDFQFHNAYLGEQPYTLELSEESAPRLGQFAGWQIVRAYMKRFPDIPLRELCRRTDYETIFKEARYRP